jgi:pseudouridine-5'-phosphate glycosidase
MPNKTDPVVAPAVAEALAAGRPVVALETTVLAHGLPWPDNLETALAMEAAIAAAGAVPASIGILGGRVQIGLSRQELETFSKGDGIAKVSRRDIGGVLARGGDGATTVAATMILADRAGIPVFATGGIGGVHRGGAASLDVSADLIELGRTPVAVVCSGAKAILDLPRTREVLETQGVPVIGFGIDALPAFHARESGLACDLRVDSAAEAATVLRRHWALGLGGALVANPVPADAAVPEAELQGWVDQAVAEAEAEGVTGAAVTPFLLDRLVALSEGRTLGANRVLLIDNARVAADIAVALAH